jgi:curli production assembly/transport component CsgG
MPACFRSLIGVLFCLLLFSGCTQRVATFGTSPAVLSPPTKNHQDLAELPPPKGKIKVAVYNFRDQTGQYKPLENVTSFSTAVPQGTATMLMQALKESGWFIPVEREGLQNLLNERKIIRAALGQQDAGNDPALPPLDFASILIEGGIVGYETNFVTGGFGARYFGLGGNTNYRMDQVTVIIRAVDVRSGWILKSLSTTKTVLSREISAGVFRFVSFKRLLEVETGITTNEPVQVATMGAIEKAVSGLVIEGIRERLWELRNPEDFNLPVIQNYLKESNLSPMAEMR